MGLWAKINLFSIVGNLTSNKFCSLMIGWDAKCYPSSVIIWLIVAIDFWWFIDRKFVSMKGGRRACGLRFLCSCQLNFWQGGVCPWYTLATAPNHSSSCQFCIENSVKIIKSNNFSITDEPTSIHSNQPIA